MKHTFRAMAVAMMAAAASGCMKGAAEMPAAAATSATPVMANTADAAIPPATGDAKHGQYLVSIMGCNDCHTPLKMGANGPEPDMDRFLTGHPEQVGPLPAATVAPEPWVWAGAATNTAFRGPWGVSYTFNLTPDRNTGIGIWTEEMFVTAIKTGRHMGHGRPIMPPMPWPAYRNATEQDLRDVFAFLRTLKPFTNHVPDAVPAEAPAAESTN